MRRNLEPMRKQVEAWHRSELTDVTATVVSNMPIDLTALKLRCRSASTSFSSEFRSVVEGHIRHHVLDPKRRPNSEQTHAADEVIDMVKTYLR
jgi:hypothetical protein